MTVRETLEKVRDDLRSGVIPPENFDMGWSWCGSAGCIGGWVGKYLGLRVLSGEFTCHDVLELESDDTRDSLHGLFYPNEQIIPNPYSATPSQAAVAIDNYLSSGDPKWKEVMGGSHA